MFDGNLSLLQDLLDEDRDFEPVFDLLGNGNKKFRDYSNDDVLNFIEKQEDSNKTKKATDDTDISPAERRTETTRGNDTRLDVHFSESVHSFCP